MMIEACLPTNMSTSREAVAWIISVARNVAQPFGTPDPSRPNISPTRWRTVSDLTKCAIIFDSTTNPNTMRARLDELDFSDGAPVNKVDLQNGLDRVGDVSSNFKPTESFEWAKSMITA